MFLNIWEISNQFYKDVLTEDDDKMKEFELGRICNICLSIFVSKQFDITSKKL